MPPVPLGLYCGTAERFAPFFALAGATGYTSGAGCIVPHLTLALHAALKAGNYLEVMRLVSVIRPIEDDRAKDGDSYNISLVKYDLEPVIRVEPGEVFQLETEDARTGKTRTPETITAEYVKGLRVKGPYYGNPVTGPVEVVGAELGDTLAIDIRDVDCDSTGFFGYWPFVYHLQDWFKEPVTQLVEIRNGHVHYVMQAAAGPHRLTIPVKPMIGCIGTAPHLEVPTAATAGKFGGNLDVPEIGAGATVYLPVAVPGALLYLGDCHPYQGDGEVSGCEMRAVVTLSVRVLKEAGPALCPRVETTRHLVAVGIGSPAETGQWQAIREMILWLEVRHEWLKDDARTLLTLTGDLRPGQMQVNPYTVRLLVQKAHLPSTTPTSVR